MSMTSILILCGTGLPCIYACRFGFGWTVPLPAIGTVYVNNVLGSEFTVVECRRKGLSWIMVGKEVSFTNGVPYNTVQCAKDWMILRHNWHIKAIEEVEA